MPTIDDARTLDAGDALAPYRDRFVLPDDDSIYACGNSLGRVPKAAIAVLRTLVEHQWAGQLVGAWDEWIDLPTRVGDVIGSIIGAQPGECVVADSTTVNFYKLAVAALRARPEGVVLTDASNFPTDRFVLQGLDCEIRWLEPEAPDEAVLDALANGSGRISLVTLSHVSYRSGARRDIGAITRAAREHGALTLWDLSHSAGAVATEVSRHGVDLAVGCTYKYLNGGPGSPAFLYVREDLRDELRQPIQGWFGAANIFAMGPDYEPAPGVERFLSGSPSVLGLAAVEEGARSVADAGIDALEAKASALTAFLVDCLDGIGEDVEVVTPRHPDRRGAHIAVRLEDAEQRCETLAKLGVVTDFRAPDVIRFGLAPLYSRYVDAWAAADRLRFALGAH